MDYKPAIGGAIWIDSRPKSLSDVGYSCRLSFPAKAGTHNHGSGIRVPRAQAPAFRGNGWGYRTGRLATARRRLETAGLGVGAPIRRALPEPRTQLNEQRDATAAGIHHARRHRQRRALPQSSSASRCTTAEPVVPTGANGNAV